MNMEERTREELAQMSHEELEVLVLHHQDEVKSLRGLLDYQKEMQEHFYGMTKQMEARMEVLLKPLQTWGVGK